MITEYDEKGIGVAMHMFDENGKHLGVFDYKKWEEEDMLNELLQKYKGQDEFRVHISKENRTVIWNYLNQKNFQISEKEYNKMNYLSGNGLVVGPAIQWYSTENAYCSYGFIGIRKILLDKNYNNEDLPDIFLHQTYLFDYTGKLKKIYNYEEMGEKLMLFEGGKKGLSQYLNSPWDEIPVKYFRIHDFKENSFLDFDAYTICNNYFREQPSFLGRQYYLGMQENKVDMVFKGGDKQETYINIIVDTQEKKAYCKVYEIPFQNGHSEWQLFTKPDGSKIDLSEYEIIKF
ncbi:MAG: hypothetical protein IPM26_04710 [Saprospiraceae bacterium]|nr:hypothetical protein [Saprospiraceae bacterium]